MELWHWTTVVQNFYAEELKEADLDRSKLGLLDTIFHFRFCVDLIYNKISAECGVSSDRHCHKTELNQETRKVYAATDENAKHDDTGKVILMSLFFQSPARQKLRKEKDGAIIKGYTLLEKLQCVFADSNPRNIKVPLLKARLK